MTMKFIGFKTKTSTMIYFINGKIVLKILKIKN